MSANPKTIILIGCLLLSSIVSVPALKSQTAKRTPHQRNAPPSIESFTPSTFALFLCPFVTDYYMVKLEAKASDPDGDVLTYHYEVTGGRIIGQGPIVDWDLRKALGQQKAVVEVTDSNGSKTSREVEISVELNTSSCDPPCNTVSVTCPETVSEGESATFAATVGGEPPEKLTYHWISNGKLIPGQEEPELKIKAVGLPGDSITVVVEVGGIDPACSRQASCESRIVKREPGSSDK
jgi:hypothetical protein